MTSQNIVAHALSRRGRKYIQINQSILCEILINSYFQSENLKLGYRRLNYYARMKVVIYAMSSRWLYMNVTTYSLLMSIISITRGGKHWIRVIKSRPSY